MEAITRRSVFIYGIVFLLLGTSIPLQVRSGMTESMILSHSGDGNYDNNHSTSDIDWWPMFGHDLARSGYSTSKAPNTKELLWKFDAGNPIYSSPTVADGKVFISSHGEPKMFCLNATDGMKLWEFASSEDMSAAAIINDRVYFCSDTGYAYCLNETTGTIIWSLLTDSTTQLTSSPAVIDGKVYFGSSYHKMYCLNADNGTVIWIFNTGTNGYVGSSPAVVNNKVFFGCQNKKIYCLNATTGTQIWNYTTGNEIDLSTPCIWNDKLYIASEDSDVYCINVSTGEKIWNYSTGGTLDSSPVIAYGNVYIGSWDWKFYCLNATSGIKKWDYYIGDVVLSAAAVADNKVYVGAHHQLFCFNATTGVKIWEYATGNYVYSSPAIANRKVYIGSTDHKFYCFRDNHNPNAPNSAYPSNGSTEIPLKINLSWAGGDPDIEDTVTYDVYFGTATPPLKVASNLTTTTFNPGPLWYNTTYFWKIIAWDNHHASTSGPIWKFTTIKDVTPPSVEISQPKTGYLYYNDQEIMKRIFSKNTLIIGPLNITVNSTDNQTGVNRVMFYIDDLLSAKITSTPYTWLWSQKMFFKHKITIISYDNEGNSNKVELSVVKFL